MKKTILILFLIISQVGIFTACTDEENSNLSITQEGIGVSLQNVVDELKPTSAFVYESKLNETTKVYEWVLTDYRSAEFEIQGTIIRVGSNYYNLNYLQKFNLYSQTTLNLYFKID